MTWWHIYLPRNPWGRIALWSDPRKQSWITGGHCACVKFIRWPSFWNGICFDIPLDFDYFRGYRLRQAAQGLRNTAGHWHRCIHLSHGGSKYCSCCCCHRRTCVEVKGFSLVLGEVYRWLFVWGVWNNIESYPYKIISSKDSLHGLQPQPSTVIWSSAHHEFLETSLGKSNLLLNDAVLMFLETSLDV